MSILICYIILFYRILPTCSFVISSVDMPSITTGVFAVFFLPFLPAFFPPFAFGGCSKQHIDHFTKFQFSFITYIAKCYKTSNVTSITEVWSASAHLFAGTWCPWWVLLLHSITSQLFFIIECGIGTFSALCV